MPKKLNILLLALVACVVSHAQYDPSYAHYWMMEPSFNPAAVGNDDKLNITGAYLMQMTGFHNAPKTMYAAADMPLIVMRQRTGLGLLFQNDELGLFSHKRFSIQYAYHWEKVFGGRLSFGVQGDMLSEQFDGTKADPGETNDPAIPTSKVTGSKIDLSSGLFFHQKKWYAGLSVLHILSPTVNLGETYQLNVDPTYYFTAGYNIKLRNPFISIHPTLLCMYDGSDFRADIGGRIEMNRENKSLYAGAIYSPEHSATVFIGGLFHGINLSYSYEAYTSMPDLKSGAHELIIKYQMDLNIYKKGRNRHKSVRYL